MEKNIKDVASASFVPLFEPSAVSDLNREDTMAVLNEIGKIAEESEINKETINRLEKQVAEGTENAEAIKKELSSTGKRLIIAVPIFVFILAWMFIGFIVGVILAIIVGIGFAVVYEQIDIKNHEAENFDRSNKYIWTVVEPLRKELKEAYEVRNEIENSGKIDWAIEIIGEEMFDSNCIFDLYNLLKSRRADNLKEALTQYDDMQYKARMEKMQADIRNASEITAQESAKQTEYQKQTAINTNEAASAAKQTAYNSRQIDRNTRKFR